MRRGRHVRAALRRSRRRPPVGRAARTHRLAHSMTDRLFFALWPDEAVRSVLVRRVPPLLERVQGKAQRPDQWHVTLEFLGTVVGDRQPAVRAAADRVEGVPFDVVFDLLDHWRRPQVYCLSASSTPPPLAQLVAEMRAALLAEGFVPESRD